MVNESLEVNVETLVRTLRSHYIWTNHDLFIYFGHFFADQTQKAQISPVWPVG